MTGLARDRLSTFAERARIETSSGAPQIPVADQTLDRILSNYVLDLLAEADIHAFLAEARRTLVPDGRLCLVSLTNGRGPLTRLVSRFWTGIWSLRPSLVGGCRPLELDEFLPAADWHTLHAEKIVAFGIYSEVRVATPAVAEK